MENHSSIATLTAIIKYANREALTVEECRTLEDWSNESPDNRELVRQFGDEQWVRDALKMMNSAPERKMWKAINRQLDKLEAEDKEIKKVSFFRRLFFRRHKL